MHYHRLWRIYWHLNDVLCREALFMLVAAEPVDKNRIPVNPTCEAVKTWLETMQQTPGGYYLDHYVENTFLYSRPVIDFRRNR